MTGTQHLATGIVIGTITSNLFLSNSIETTLVCLSGCILGAILPDIDKENTMIGNTLPILNRIVTCFTSHRGILHDIGIFIGLNTFLFIFLQSYLFTNLIWTFLPCLVFGYCSHLVVDGFSKGGIPFFGHIIHFLPQCFCYRVTKQSKNHYCYKATISSWLFTFLFNSGLIYLWKVCL